MKLKSREGTVTNPAGDEDITPAITSNCIAMMSEIFILETTKYMPNRGSPAAMRTGSAQARREQRRVGSVSARRGGVRGEGAMALGWAYWWGGLGADLVCGFGV